MIAIAFQFSVAGLLAIAMGWWTRAKADQLAEANERICRRFIPGRLGSLAGKVVDASTYRAAGVLLAAFGALVTIASLFG